MRYVFLLLNILPRELTHFQNDEEELQRRGVERQRAFLLADNSENETDDDDKAELTFDGYDVDEQELALQRHLNKEEVEVEVCEPCEDELDNETFCCEVCE